MTAARLLEWHREKAGSIELVHDVIKNELGGGVLPSKFWRQCGLVAVGGDRS